MTNDGYWIHDKTRNEVASIEADNAKLRLELRELCDAADAYLDSSVDETDKIKSFMRVVYKAREALSTTPDVAKPVAKGAP